MTPDDDLTGRLILGIDLGTTNSAVAVWDEAAGAVRVLATAAGDLLVPSVVAWDAGRSEWVVGRAAEAIGATDPGRAAGSVKRLIGRRAGDPVVGFARAQTAVRLTDAAGADPLQEVTVEFGPAGPRLSAPEVSAKVLGELRRVAAAALGRPVEEVTHAVVTVPAYFNDFQRRATRLAGELAGLTVVDLLDEPTAAALAYTELTPDYRWVVVLDLGGGTFDVSVLEAARTDCGYVFAVSGADGDTYLGGDDIDAALTGWLADQLRDAHGLTLDRDDPAARDALRRAARAAKEALSTAAETTVEVCGRSVVVPAAAAEAAARRVIDRVKTIADRAVARAGRKWADVSEVILVGGQAHAPALRAAVEALTGRPPRCDRPPELAVALGAGEYARVLARGADRFHENALVSVIALPLGVRLDENTFAPLIRANSTLPCRSDPFPVTTREDNQPLIRVEVLQGSGEGADDRADRCTLLGSLEMLVPPAPAGKHRFDVTFEARRDGTLGVTIHDPRRPEVDEVRDVVGRQVVAWRASVK